MNLIEGWGTGIPRLLREMKEYGLAEPEFIDMEIALRINLYRSADIVQDSAQNISEDNSKTQYDAHKMRENKKVRDKCAISALNRELSAQEKTILEFINENGSITSGRTMELLNLKKRRTQVILGQMIKDGLICKMGAGRSTCYTFDEPLVKK